MTTIRRPRRLLVSGTAVAVLLVLASCAASPTDPAQQCRAAKTFVSLAQQEATVAFHDTVSRRPVGLQPLQVQLATVSLELRRNAATLTDRELRSALTTAASALERNLRDRDLLAGGRALRRLDGMVDLECGS